ncbi:MAG: DUF2953 domain-containing protein [Bacillota bacterium]|nr:DUF2953 domain-containing protein [Bacillota bacterium]
MLLLPVNLIITYKTEIEAKLKVLFFTYYLIQKKRKPKTSSEKQLKKSKEMAKPSFLSEVWEKKGLEGILDLLKTFASVSKTVYKSLTNYVVIKNMKVFISVGGDDAADVAIKYGYVCSAVFTSTGIIIANFKTKSHDIKIKPNYYSEETEIDCCIHGKIRVIFILISSIHISRIIFRAKQKQLKSDIQENKGAINNE